MQLFENTLPEIVAKAQYSSLFHRSLRDVEGYVLLETLAEIMEEYPKEMIQWLCKRTGIPSRNIRHLTTIPDKEYFPSKLVVFMGKRKKGEAIVIKHLTFLPRSHSHYLTKLTEELRARYGDRARCILVCSDDIFITAKLNNERLIQDWSICDYSEIAEILKTLPARSEYHAELLNDCVFTLNQFCRFHDAVSNLSYDAPFLGTFREWKDTFEKGDLSDVVVVFTLISAIHIRCQAIVQEICTRLEVPLAIALRYEIGVAGDIYSHIKNLSDTPEEPKIQVKVLVHTDSESLISLGVEINGNHFRLFMEARSTNLSKYRQFAIRLREENSWFTFQETPELQVLERLWSGDSQTQDLCSDWDCAAYCYKSFADSVSADEIINAIVLYVQYARKFVVAGNFLIQD